MNEIKHLIEEIQAEAKSTRVMIANLIEEKSQIVDWMTEQEVMTTLNVSKKRLKSLCRKGFLAFSKVNTVTFYKRADILQLIEKNYSMKTQAN